VLAAHAGGVFCLVALPGTRVASGGADGAVRVWAIAAGPADSASTAAAAAAEMNLPAAHAGAVWALATGRAGGAGSRLLASAGADGAVRVWPLGPGADGRPAAEVLDAAGPRRFVGCLAVCGPRLVGGARGTAAGWPGGAGMVRVWELEGLREAATLARTAGGGDVNVLLADGWEVWVGDENGAAVWGRRAA
jgi:WD40 repeat protein